MKIDELKFDGRGLLPAVVQDARTGVVLMQAWMNREALEKTLETGFVTFFSRSRARLWTKGEESGNVLRLKEIRSDCDNDCLLVKAEPAGPVCHTGADTCWGETNAPQTPPCEDAAPAENATDGQPFSLAYLEAYLSQRRNDPPEESYTARLFAKGINKIAQKVGEEAVELIIEAKDDDRELFLGEAADLMYHYIVLLLAKGFSLADVTQVLAGRHKK